MSQNGWYSYECDKCHKTWNKTCQDYIIMGKNPDGTQQLQHHRYEVKITNGISEPVPACGGNIIRTLHMEDYMKKVEVNGVVIEHTERLNYYAKEHVLYREAYNTRLNSEQATLIFEKMKRHYKLNGLTVEYNGRKKGGTACGKYHIELGTNTSMGILAHEISHIIDARKRGVSKHDKKLARIQKKVMNYCKKQGYWTETLKKKKTQEDERNRKLCQMANEKARTMAERLSYKKTDEYKVEKLTLKMKQLEKEMKTRQKRLKETSRKLKYYQNKIDKRSDNYKNHQPQPTT